MNGETLNILITLFGAGLGLLFAAGFGFGLVRIGVGVQTRFGIGGALSVSGGLLAATYAPWSFALAAAGIALALFVSIQFLRSSLLTKAVAGIHSLARRPVGQSMMLAAAGLFVMGGSSYYLTVADEAAIDADMALMVEAGWRPDTRVSTTESAVTDSGNSITLCEAVELRDKTEISAIEKRTISDKVYDGQLIRIAPPCDSHNCHGWVFTGGRYWLSPDDVARILVDNHYEQVSDPRPGDVVIYRQGDVIAHTAVVRAPAANGRPVLVEGKWGWMGVYLHGVDQSPYGKTYTYYRSSREGHVLVGLGGKSTGVAQKPIPPQADNLATE